MLSFPFFDPSRPPPVAPPPNQSALDQSFVQHFVSTRAERRIANKSAPASISELKQKITNLVSEIDLLKTKKATLEKEMHLQPDSSWQSNIEQLEQLQQNISDKLNQLSDPPLNEQLRRKLRARHKKRSWQKRRNALLKVQKDAQRTNRNQLHERIDQWQCEQRKLLEEEKLVQQQLDFASHFLADVHRRKAACKRYLAKFEKVRESRRRYQHEDDCDDDADLAELTKKWTAKLAACVREEKRLKDVLARRSAANYQRRVENEWNRALFGDVISKKPDRDREVLVQTRWNWDAFLVGEGDDDAGDDASAIPLGWVLPPKDPAPEWAQYLTKAFGGV
uniref:Putative programmed cell death protein n=1 Tax=Culex tarsalis TaxID=7177 RepID=A0A1Q3FG79_CULTA